MRKHNKEYIKLAEYEYSERESAGSLIFVISYPKKLRLKLNEGFDQICIGYVTTEINSKEVKYKINMFQLDEKTYTLLKEIFLKHKQYIYIRRPY